MKADKETMDAYKSFVKFVPAIKDNLSNIDNMIDKIHILLGKIRKYCTICFSTNCDCVSDLAFCVKCFDVNCCCTTDNLLPFKIDAGERDEDIHALDKEHQTFLDNPKFLKMFDYPTLFHKYFLLLMNASSPITYEIRDEVVDYDGEREISAYNYVEPDDDLEMKDVLLRVCSNCGCVFHRRRFGAHRASCTIALDWDETAKHKENCTSYLELEDATEDEAPTEYILGYPCIRPNCASIAKHNLLCEMHLEESKLCKKNKLFAHLHCYDISKFDEISICRYFNVVITYSIGEYTLSDGRFVVLKIPNKGMDIGAKFCMVQYLQDQQIDYRYILFLHSKSNPATRRKYFAPLISYFEEEEMANEFIENINDYDGYFPDIQWEIQGDRLKMISGNPQYADSNLPERNLEYRNELLDYLGCEHRTNRFVEGNVYILSKDIVERLFGDKKLYNILNRPDDFDYNWVRKRHRLQGDFGEVYNEFVTKKLSPRDELSYDGYIEHAFERVVLNVCENSQIVTNPNEINNIFCPFISTGEFKNYAIQTNNEGPLLNILIRTSGRPNLFNDLLFSIRTQTYSNVRLIIAVDSPHSYNSYIKCNKLIRKTDKVLIIDKDKYSKFGKCFYNMYFNEMYKYINEGWITHIDDDNILMKQTSLSIITNYMVDSNRLIMWKHNIIGRVIPKDWKIVRANVDTNMICFYYEYLDKLIPWNNSDTADFDIIKNLEQRTNGIEKVDEILTTINTCNRTETRGYGKRNDREYI